MATQAEAEDSQVVYQEQPQTPQSASTASDNGNFPDFVLPQQGSGSFEEPDFFKTRTASVDSVTSVASSVDDLTVEMKVQWKKRAIFIALLVIVGVVVASVLFYGAHEVTDGFKTGTKNKVTKEMVLPNTTLDITVISDSKTKGEIYYYQSEYSPNELGFNFFSFYNETHDIVSFICQTEDKLLIDSNYNSLLHGFCGFEIDLIGSYKEAPHNSSSYGVDHNSSLKISILSCEQPSTVTTVLWEHSNAENNDDSGESVDNTDAIKSLAIGKLGQYFVELSIKLGSNQYMGYEMLSVQFITSYARYFWQLCDANETYCNWDKKVLKEAVSLTNQIISGNTSKSDETVAITSDDGASGSSSDGSTTSDTTIKKDDVEGDSETRRLLGSCTGNWHWVGDGYCDSSLNNVACGLDGGDCCQHTCDPGVNWEDEDGVDYSGYSCGSGGYNCVPDCSVSNPSWLGDGYCDKTGGYNTAACGYDLGDCCEDLCKPGAYSCGSNGYDCPVNEPTYCPRDHCGNECFGMCGAGCDCWTWSCGDCHCHGECSEHDGYCSCNSMFDFWCVNVFWITCDDGSNAIF